MILFYDTETTGFPKKHLPLSNETQPHLVQIAALLCTPDGTEEAMISLIIDNDVEIPEVVVAIHGITTEKAALYGVDLWSAVNVLNELATQADIIVGHNLQFDDKIMEIAAIRAEHKLTYLLKHPSKFCTLEAMTPICRIPKKHPMKDDPWKWPKLQEAYKHFFGVNFEGAHNALADVRATKDVYFAYKEQKRNGQLVE